MIEEKRIAYALPDRKELPERVGAALGVVYAMFNEGHTSRSGALMRLDLQAEALRLARLELHAQEGAAHLVAGQGAALVFEAIDRRVEQGTGL